MKQRSLKTKLLLLTMGLFLASGLAMTLMQSSSLNTLRSNIVSQTRQALEQEVSRTLQFQAERYAVQIADLLQQSFDGFTKDTGIEVVYTGDKGFEGNIVTKVTGGDAPDLAIVPQPGLLKTLIGTGDVVKAPSAVDKAVDENWSPDWKAYGTVDGTFYAAPMLANVKGYVWYSPAKFKEWGVSVPKTWDDLMTLTQTIQQKTGAAPWCAGFASGDGAQLVFIEFRR